MHRLFASFRIFIVKKLLGWPMSPMSCTLASLGHSIPHWGDTFPRIQNMVFPKVDLGCLNIRQLNCVVSGPKFTHSFAQPEWGCSWSFVFFRFSISQSVPEIFAIGLKLSQIEPNCAHKKLRVKAPKNCTHVFIPTSRHMTWTSLVTLFPLAPKLSALMHNIFRIFAVPNFLGGTQIFGPNL